MKAGRHQRVLGAGIAIGVVVLTTVVYIGRDHHPSGQVTKEIPPTFVTPVNADGSALNVDVGFPWAEHGFCAGQFQVKASESVGQIRVGAVISRTHSVGNCAGIGSNGKWATASLRLSLPIGDRVVLRASDGAVLPVFALTATLRCTDAISGLASPEADQTVIFNGVGLPKNALQANRSGETDPSARLFAKTGLEVAAHSRFMLSLSDEWMGRVTIGWGNPGMRTMNLYVPGCISDYPWLVFAGGFWVAQPACVPLVVDSGTQQERLEIGVGTACPGQAQPPAGS